MAPFKTSVEVEIAKDPLLTPKDKSAMLALYYVLIGREFGREHRE